MSLSKAENVIVAGADNRPLMHDKTQYSSWASRMLLYIKGKENKKLLFDSILNGPFKYGNVVVPKTQTIHETARDRTYDEHTNAEKLCESCDIKATKMFYKAYPKERESKMYHEFDMFISVPGEIVHLYYLTFAQLINNMHSIGMTMRPIQVNTKFINHLQPEWRKFVTDAKLAKDLNNINFDQFLNKTMAFISTAFTSRYPPMNNDLRTLSNQGIRKLSKMEELPCRQFRKDKIRGMQAVVLGVMLQALTELRELIQHVRLRNSVWFKENVMLAEALESGMLLDEEHMAFLADNGDTALFASVVLMAKLSSYDSKVLLEAKEDKYLDEIIDLEKKNKALDNVIYKIGQTMQTMYMLTKPQVFYDESHKAALGYRKPLYLTQAQRKVPALYCGNIIVKQHDALSIIDTNETLELAAESRIKMHAK
nr:hypothetical protein [Tanacetum cinerariifolium]